MKKIFLIRECFAIPKINLKLKLSFILLFISLFEIQAEVYSQKNITLNLNDVPVEKVFTEIKKNTDFNVLFLNLDIDLERKVSIKVSKAPVTRVLDILFNNTNITYQIEGRQIILTKRKTNTNKFSLKNENIKDSKLQNIDISGSVLDNKGQALPGANILEKGTTNGTQTDFDGKFSLSVTNENAILIISYIGFKTSEVPINGQAELTITLKEDAAGLDEIVIVGYGTQRKSDLTGSVSAVSSDDFENQPVTRIDQALQSRSAGVQVSQTSGAPGAGFKIRVRGTNSINGSNDPLYVVDGLVVGNISTINVNDIKSIEVLKDASATAVYGSRGANGVVLLTTKSGKVGETSFNFDAFTGFQSVRKNLDIMNGADFAETVNASNTGTNYTAEEIAVLRTNGGTDWQDAVFQIAPISSFQLSVNGGNETTNYYISGSYLTQEGIVRNQDYKRYSLRTNLNTSLGKKIKLGTNIYLSHDENDGQAANINNVVTFDPTTSVFDSEGNYNFSSIKSVATGEINPLLLADSNTLEKMNNQLIASVNLSYEIADHWTFGVLGGLEHLNTKQNSYIPIVVNQQGDAEVFDYVNLRLQNTNMITYQNDDNENHRIKLDLIHEQQYTSFAVNESTAEGFPTDESTYKILSLGAVQQTSNFFSDERLQSFVGRLNYSFANKLLFTGTVRADGSSKFRKDNRWGVFPSASMAWKVLSDEFKAENNTLNNLKVRVSYGLTGSQAIDALDTRARAISGVQYNYPFDGGTSTVGIAPSERIENPDLTWETTKQFNVGVDMSLFSSRVNLSFDWYKKNTNDLLLDVILPEFVGANIITRNIGEIENKGFDINLGVRVIDNGDFKINTNFTLSRNRNEVLSLVDDTPISNLGETYLGPGFNNVPPTHIEVGQSLGTFRGYIFEGVYQTGETTIANRKAGDPRYTDLNDDGIISAEDITNVGNGNPDFTWGLNTDIIYKRLSLNILIQGSSGGEIYNFIKGRQVGLGSGTFHGVHEDVKNSWTTTNPSNVPALDKTAGSHQLLSTEFLEDGSFVRFKNISLGYDLNENILSKLRMDSMKLYVSIENAFTITNYSGYDPEISSSANSDIDLGIDRDAYPLAKTINLGVNISF